MRTTRCDRKRHGSVRDMSSAMTSGILRRTMPPEHAEAFIEWPSASLRKPSVRVEEHNGERGHAPKPLHS